MEKLKHQDIRAILANMAELMAQKRDELTELDGVIGDGDLGLTMSNGFRKVTEGLESVDETDVGKVLAKAGMVMASAVPSTMGTLMATGLMKSGRVAQGKLEIGLGDLAAMMTEFVAGIMARGKAQPGDKTIIDSLHPAALALMAADAEGKTLSEGLMAAYQASVRGLEETRRMISQHGKAACFQEKTLGKQDPGATVGMLFIKVLADYVNCPSDLRKASEADNPCC